MPFGPTLTPLDFGGGFPGAFSAWSYRKTWTPTSFSGTQRVLVRLADDADITANALRSGADIRFTEDDGTTTLDYELIGAEQVVQTSNMWSWFMRPHAVGDGSNVYVAFLTIDGYIGVSKYVQSTRTYTHGLLQSTPINEIDDHNTPTIFIRGDGKLIVFWTLHSTDQYVYYRISSSAGDPTAWGAEQKLDNGASNLVTYTQVHELGSTLYLICRAGTGAGDREWSYWTSSDDGDTWSGSRQNFWDPGVNNGYVISQSRGSGRIDFVASADDGDSTPQTFYHFYTDGSNWYEPDGSVLSTGTASLPLTPGGLDSTSSDIFTLDGTDKGWITDVVFGDDSEPHILANIYPSGADENHDGYSFSFNGTSWDSGIKIADRGGSYNTGSPKYPGGLVFGTNENTLYMSMERSGVREIEKWTKSGGSWSQDTVITSGSSQDNFNVVYVEGAQTADFECCWLGYGDTFVGAPTYQAKGGCQAYPGRRAWDYAWVKVTSSDPIYVYYGNSSASDAQDANAVWTGDYDYVVHPPQRGDRIDVLAASIGGNFSNADGARYWLGVNDIFATFLTSFFGTDDTVTPRWEGPAWAIEGATDVYALAWVKWVNSVVGPHPIFSNWQTSGNNARFMFRIDESPAGVLLMNVGTEPDASESMSSTDTASAGAWHQVVGIFDGGNTQLITRVDKQTQDTGSITGSAMDATANATGTAIFGTPQTDGHKLYGELMFVKANSGSFPTQAQSDLEYDMVNNTSWGTFGSQETG